MKNFTAFLKKTDDGWWASFCVEVPGAHSQGRTKEEALENLKDAIEMLLDIRKEEFFEEYKGDIELADLALT